MKMILLMIFRKKLKFLMNSLQNNVPNSSKLSDVFIRKTDKYLSTLIFYENEIKNLFVILILKNLMGMTCLVFTC